MPRWNVGHVNEGTFRTLVLEYQSLEREPTLQRPHQ